MKIIKIISLLIITLFISCNIVHADIWGPDGLTEFPNHTMCEYTISDGNVLKLTLGSQITPSISSGSDYVLSSDVETPILMQGNNSCLDPLYIVVDTSKTPNEILMIQTSSDLSDYQHSQEDENGFINMTEDEYLEAYNNGWPGVTCTFTGPDFEVILSAGTSNSYYNPYTSSYIGLESISYSSDVTSYVGTFNSSNMVSGFQTASGNWHCPDRIYYTKNSLNNVTGFTTIMPVDNFYDAGLTFSTQDNNVSNVELKKINYIHNAEDQQNYIPVDDGVFHFCNQKGVLKSLSILRTCIVIAKICAALIVIVLGSFEFRGALISGDEKDLKSAVNSLVRRLIIAAVIVFVPTLVNTIMNFVTSDTGDFAACKECFTNEFGMCDTYIENAQD